MKSLKYTGLLSVLFMLFASSCNIYIDDNGPDVFLPTGDLEVRLTTPSGFIIEGAEVTLYQSYQDAVNYRYPIGKGYTDRYGVTIFYDLPVGARYYARAQGSQAFSLGEVFIEFEGLWILPMELI